MNQIILRVSKEKERNWAYLLSERYGKNKSVETLFKMAIFEIVGDEATKILKDFDDVDCKGWAENKT